MTYIIQLRRGPAAEWITDNPVLRPGEAGVELTTGKFKIGDGIQHWTALPYFIPEDDILDAIDAAIEAIVVGSGVTIDDNSTTSTTETYSVAKIKALNDAQDSVIGGKATTSHTHTLSQITDAASKADDSVVVKLTGVQTINGTKTFGSAPVVPDSSFIIAKTSGLQAALDAKAVIVDSSATNATTTTYSANKINIAIAAAIAALVGTAPGILDTLGEISDALNDDANAVATLVAALAGKQPLDSDLTTIAGLNPTTDSFMQAKAGAWAARTIAQVKTDLGLTGTNSGDQGSIVGIVGTKAQFDTALTDGDFLYVGDAGSYTDENAQDAVGTILTDTATIDFVYTDATPTITADVKDNSITFAKVQDVSATSRVLGRITSGSGDIEELTSANIRTIIGLQADLDAKQNLDSDLTTIAGLTATTDSFLQAKGSVWAARTIAQVKTDLGLTGTNSGDQTTIVGITGTKAQFDTAVTDGDILYVGDVTSFTDEAAQDAIGTILVDTSTIDLTYNDGTPSITAAVISQMSITSDGSGLKLSGDSATPGNAKLYGTDGSGVKGWYSQPGGTGITDGDKGDITVSSSGLVWTVDNSAITLAKIANIATSRVLGRITASSGVVEELTGIDVRTIAGLATLDSPQFTAIELGAATDTTIARVSAGVVSIEGVTIATASNTLTLTNKTLTSPAINTPTGIVKGDVGLGNVDNTSNATERAATATLTNKTLTSPRINEFLDINGLKIMTMNASASAVNYLRVDNSAAGGALAIVAVGTDTNISLNLIPKGSGFLQANGAAVVTTSGTQTLSNKTLNSPVIATIVNTGTLTLPTSTDTLVGRATTDTLTNKTLTSPVINTPTGIVKGDVGLGNIDNTSDANKPVSIATQSALDAKQGLDSDLTTIAGLTATTDSFLQAKAGAWAARTIAQVKTDLGLTGTNSGDQTSIVGITGTKAQFDTAVTDGNILYVGDVVGVTDADKGDITVSSSGTVWTIDNDAVTYAKMQNVSATSRVLGRITAGAGDTEELTAANIRTIINVADGATVYNDEAAQDAVGAMLVDSTTIDLTYTDVTPALTAAVISQMSITSDASGIKLSGDSATPGNTKLYGTDGSGVKGWYDQPAGGAGVSDGDKGDITVSSSGTVWTIDNNVVTYAKMQDISATSRILGRITAAAGDAEELTGANVRTITGLATGDSPQFTGIELGHATDTTIARVSAGVISVEGVTIPTISSTSTLTNKTLTSPVINTPTGIAKADISGLGTADSPQFTGIELGNASDTTLTRSAAGVLAVEGVVIPSISSTNTLTNKRVTPRTGTTTSSATPTINTDNVDFYSITALTTAITSMTTNLSGTPTDGQKLWIAITGTAARAITWGASFEASTVALPTTTVTTNRLDVGFVWNAVTSKWRCVATV